MNLTDKAAIEWRPSGTEENTKLNNQRCICVMMTQKEVAVQTRFQVFEKLRTFPKD